jgi:tetratricopeptide (TPR) repeat protein
VTVLFADLKGSMELLADRDPEEAQAILDPVLDRMMHAVHRYEGTVNQVMGDGIMALFGAPVAHEDHAVRACYAALAVQEAIRHYTEELRCAHGIAVKSLDGERLHERIGLDRLLLAVTCRAWLVRCLAEVVEHPFSQRIAFDGAGILSLRQGDLPQAVLWLERGLELRQAMGIKRYPGFPGEFFALGCAYALSGRLTEARLQLEEGTSKERGHEGWALRLLGEIYMRQDPPAIQAAKTSYDQALVVAEELRMRPLLAHCHLGRGELLATMGQRELARDDLCTARDLYRSMAMTFWAARAQAALAQSSG